MNTTFPLPTPTQEQFLEKNYNKLRKEFENHLVDVCLYPRAIAENSDDGRDDFVEREYGLYLVNLDDANKIITDALVTDNTN